jgi:dihydrofolate reductase
MRKLIVCNIMSLDGYVDGPGGSVMVLPMDNYFNEHNLERLRAADTLLLGARTYTGFKSFWPAVADDPTVAPAVAANPEVAEVTRETGQRNNQIQKTVVSDSLTADDTAPWTDTTTIVRRADAHQAIADLKSQPGREILTFGSRTLWNDLLTAGLVDELHLMLGATVLGGGTPAFPRANVPPLRLLTTERRGPSNNLLLRYAVENSST